MSQGSTTARGGRGRGRGGRRSNGRRVRINDIGQDGLTLNRHFSININRAGGTGFDSTVVPISANTFADLIPFARQYTEYRFSNFRVSLIQTAGSNAAGQKFVYFSFVSPTLLVNSYQAASASSGFRTNSFASGSNLSSRLPRGANMQKFYPVFQANLTADQLLDPNIIQAWLIYGTNLANPAQVIQCEISCRLLLRGPTRPVGEADTMASLIQPELYAHISEDEEEDEHDLSLVEH